MNLEPSEKVLVTIENARGAVRYWKNHPADYEAAFRAAVYYAKAWNAPAVVIPGNSYGHRVYHIANEGADLSRFCPGVPKPVTVAVAYPDGTVKEAQAS